MAERIAQSRFSEQEILNALYDPTTNTLRFGEAAEAVYAVEAFQATITSANATTATTIKANAEAGTSIYITDLIISTDTAMNIQLQDSTAVTPLVMMEQIYMPAVSVFSKTFRIPIKVTAAKDLNVIASASGNISVFVSGYLI